MTATPRTTIDNGDLSTEIRAAYTAKNTITARAGGGQANATQLTAVFNRVTVVASGGDSVKLPAAKAGAMVYIKNTAANSLDVFPQTGGVINALSPNAAYALATVKSAAFFCAVDGTWDTVLTA